MSTLGNPFTARLTGYWPFTATPAEVSMEGGTNDRKGNPLHTLEDFQSGNASFVSVSGDPTIFPYGQRLSIDYWPDVVFRVVDTGSHFTGPTKVYRQPGVEPLDICVASSQTFVPVNASVTTLDESGAPADAGVGSGLAYGADAGANAVTADSSDAAGGAGMLAALLVVAVLLYFVLEAS